MWNISSTHSKPFVFDFSFNMYENHLCCLSTTNCWFKCNEKNFNKKSHDINNKNCTSHRSILIKSFVAKDTRLRIMIVIQFKYLSTFFVCSLDSTSKSSYIVWILFQFQQSGWIKFIMTLVICSQVHWRSPKWSPDSIMKKSW